MKLKIFLNLTLIFSLHVCLSKSFAQRIDSHGNEIVPGITGSEDFSIQLRATDTAATICNSPNTFWCIVDNGTARTAYEYELLNNTVISTGNFVPDVPGWSLAICNALNGGTPSPTLYSSNGDTCFQWMGGNSWSVAGLSNLTYPIGNAGGYGMQLNFHDQNFPSAISSYDGTSFTQIFASYKYSGIADIAVDDVGNIYHVSCPSFPNTDSLYIISPSGQILNQYSINYDAGNAYGCMIIDDVFYIGFGPMASLYPDKLVPVTLGINSASLGTPIQMPFGNGWDLASCNTGPVGLNDVSSDITIHYFPNPVQDLLYINHGLKTKMLFEIYSDNGKLVYREHKSENAFTINVSQLSSGVYFLKTTSENMVSLKKFLKN